MPRHSILVLILLALCTSAVCGSPKVTRHPLVQSADSLSAISPRTVNPLFGLSAMIAEALPSVNSDGTANQARQDMAVKMGVDSLVRNKLIDAPSLTITVDDMKYFAVTVTHTMSGYKDIRITSPLLVWLKTVVKSNTDSSGVVNWTGCTATQPCVQGDVNDLVSIALTAGQVTLDPGVTPDQLKAFAFDLAKAVDAYNQAGY